MDISETYIKMCEKAKEIQAQHQVWAPLQYANEGDYIFVNGVVYLTRLNGWTDRQIWLPRQDQLQEMVLESEHYNDLPHLYQNFAEFLVPYQLAESLVRREDHWTALAEMAENKRYILQFTSWEQLWLAFVMKEKFNEIWNGEEWI